MTEEEYAQFEQEAHSYLTARQDVLRNEYGLSDYEWWNYDQETGDFVFSNQGVPALTAKFQVVGSISNQSNTWLWSWANPSILEPVKEQLYLIREFGEQNSLLELTEAKWKADEYDGWAMTSISAKLLDAIGAYRCPDENGFLFVIFTEIRRILN
jgi:hypothetical protein